MFKVVSRDIFAPSPKNRVGVFGSSFYTRPSGGELIGFHHHISRSDIFHDGYVRYSTDNGRHWTEPLQWPMGFKDPGGVGRRDVHIGYVDPPTGRFILFWNEAVLPTDDYRQAMLTGTIRYKISTDGGHRWANEAQVIHEGQGYDARHILPEVTLGTNCIMFGDLTCRPMTRRDGVILVPVQSSPTNVAERMRLTGVYTFTDCLVLMGRWQPDGRLTWRASQRIRGDAARSTRGWIEPTIAELADGSLLMAMRGSNDGKPALPGRRWVSRSRDGGETWTDPVAWTYDDGTPFYSPSSCSQLVPYSDGRLFWVGNICPTNPTGNLPRYPLVIGEVDRRTGLLLRRSVTAIDDRQPEESTWLTLSNFYVREDRETHQLVLHLSRCFAHEVGKDWPQDWTADAMLYRIEVGATP